MPELGMQTNGQEYIVRCVFCGDSENLSHGHLSINVHTHFYRCLRCGEKGKADGSFITENHLPIFPEFERKTEHIGKSKIEIIYPFSVSGRKSSLDVFTVKYMEREFDAVEVYTLSGTPLGYHLRSSKPKMSVTLTNGFKGLAYKNTGKGLQSFFDKPVRLVEGIYDCLEPTDVAVLGTINASVHELVRDQTVILRPDGDVWQKPHLGKSFFKAVARLYYSTSVYLWGIEGIKNGLDIDEIPDYNRYHEYVQFIPRSKLKEII